MGGDIDWNVPILGGEQMYQALKSLGRETELVVYPGEYHGFKAPSHLKDRLERNLSWYAHYVKADGARRGQQRLRKQISRPVVGAFFENQAWLRLHPIRWMFPNMHSFWHTISCTSPVAHRPDLRRAAGAADGQPAASQHEPAIGQKLTARASESR